MITLLLGLFIVLFAMSTLDSHKFDSLRDSLSQTFNGGQVLTQPGNVLPSSQGAVTPTSTDAPSARAIQRAQSVRNQSKQQFHQETKQIQKLINQQGLGSTVKVAEGDRGIVITLAGDALFDSGSYRLKPGVQDKLTKLERHLKKFGRDIEIAGHTDGQPFHGSPTGNWELSSRRAMAVLLFFLDKGYPEDKMTPQFFADTRPAVEPPKNDPDRPMKQNRRIEITILAPGANDGRTETQRVADLASSPIVADAVDSAVAGMPADAMTDFDIATDLANQAKAINP
jgi:chemotaxis protein MotB